MIFLAKVYFSRSLYAVLQFILRALPPLVTHSGGFLAADCGEFATACFFSIAFVPSTLCGGEDICGATGFSHLSYVEPIDAVVCWVFRQAE